MKRKIVKLFRVFANIDREKTLSATREVHPKSSRPGCTNAYFCYLRATEDSRARVYKMFVMNRKD